MDNIKDIQKKVILLGDGAVGKTSLIRRFVVDKFDDKYILTIGSKVTAKKIQIKKEDDLFNMKLQIWDILGQQGYKKLHQASFRGTDGVMMVTDITRRATLNSLMDYWIPEVHNIVGTIPFIFLANKSDLSESMDFEESALEELAAKHDAHYFLTSAKNGENVKKAFLSLGLSMMEKRRSQKHRTSAGQEPLIKRGKMTELIDRIIDDFCTEYGKMEDAMPVLRRQFELAELDLNKPSIEALVRAVERLAEIESHFKNRRKTDANLTKRLKWIREISHR